VCKHGDPTIIVLILEGSVIPAWTSKEKMLKVSA
jgi:hypothetical protein